jgi:hypothetical protein
MADMKRALRIATTVFGTALAALAVDLRVSRADGADAAFRPPAVPLVASDPYLSIWSEADHLTDKNTVHWTGRQHSLKTLIRIDGKAYRLMGADPATVPAFPQVGVQVLPTRSIYEFDDSHVHVTMTFMTPALPHNLDVLTRPVTYITWDVRAVDGAAHGVSIYDSTSSQLTVNTPQQKVQWGRDTAEGLVALRVGTVDQTLFQPAGDDTRITWGYAYEAAPTGHTTATIGDDEALLNQFAEKGDLPAQDDTQMPRATNDHQPVLALALDFGSVKDTTVSRHVMVAYDELYAIKFFGTKLQPFWRRNGASAADLLHEAEHDYAHLQKECAEFDTALMADLTKVGGARYAQISALAYRQCLAATGIAADTHKQPLLFTKENTSNGDIATVDVIFPMDPMMVVMSPTLAKASLVPVLVYAASSHWHFPNAPHDLGTYPIARGTDDGGEGMPVEESGNMIILCDAIAQEDGNADFVKPWWPQITQWAQYLEKYGLDPEEQLCTDDFMGHLAHNANLSVKAILGLAAYGDLCRLRGDTETAKKYMDLARVDAQHWVKVASDGDHYRLAFDKPNTWSQKYNLVWDKILGLNIFPPQVAQQEIAHYKKMMQKYGVPLDSRTHLTKTDWSVWSATLADNQADFETIVSPIYDYLTTTTARSPLADSYVTDDIHSDGMHARSVVGGIFVKLLSDPAMWKKWSHRDRFNAGDWAAMPVPPTLAEVVPDSEHQPITWNYTTAKPSQDWYQPTFDAGSWKQGPGGFGSRGTPNLVVGTEWKTDDIWLRREFTMPEGKFDDLQLLVYHDEDVEIYINGIPAASSSGFDNSYSPMEISSEARQSLKPGARIVLAVHCHQTAGGQGVDVGLVNVKEYPQ